VECVLEEPYILPLTWIAENSGKDGVVVCEKVMEAEGAHGYNAAKDRYEDLVEAGVIDATKVVRCALENAASVAILILTSGELISRAGINGRCMPRIRATLPVDRWSCLPKPIAVDHPTKSRIAAAS
jgi:TCP-1/cpn60 chaperonin family protein